MICILPAQQLIIVDERIDFGKFAGTSYFIVQGSLESKLPIWTDGKAQPGRNSNVEKVRREMIRDGDSQKREDAGARKGREGAKHCVFPMFCGSGGSKGRLAKAAGERHLGK